MLNVTSEPIDKQLLAFVRWWFDRLASWSLNRSMRRIGRTQHFRNQMFLGRLVEDVVDSTDFVLESVENAEELSGVLVTETGKKFRKVSKEVGQVGGLSQLDLDADFNQA